MYRHGVTAQMGTGVQFVQTRSLWLAAAVLVVLGGCSPTDTGQSAGDAGVSDDAAALVDASRSDEDGRSDAGGAGAELTWRFAAGPNGGVSRLVRIGQQLYAIRVHSGAFEPRFEVLGQSEDGGHSWSRLGDDELDELVAEHPRFLHAVQSAGKTLVFAEDTIFREEREGSWSAIEPRPPAALSLPSASGELIAYVGRLHDRDGLAVSVDGGVTWRLQRGHPESRFHSVRVWKGKIFARGYSGLQVSEDEGATWTQSLEESIPALDDWALLSQGIASFGRARDHDGQMFFFSEDGLSWQRHSPPASAPRVQQLLAIDERIIALGEDGTVAEIGSDGAWTTLSPPPDRAGRIGDAVATSSGFVALQAGALRVWSLEQGWAQSLGELGLSSGEPYLGASDAWVAAQDVLFVLRDGNWSRVEYPFEHPDLIGPYAGGFIVADEWHCFYQRGDDDWRFLLQWRQDGVHTDECDTSIYNDALLDGPISWQDKTLIRREGDASGVLDLAGHELELPADVGLHDLASARAHLWLVGDKRLYQRVDGELVDKTDALAGLVGEEVEVTRIAGAGGLLVVDTAKPQVSGPGHFFILNDDGWTTFPAPKPDTWFHIEAVSEHGVWTLIDGAAWLYDLGAARWRTVSEGLPGNAQIRRLSARDGRVVVTTRGGGLWELDSP